MDAPVKVQVRIKPSANLKIVHLNDVELQHDEEIILVKLSSTKVQFNEEKVFHFDHVYETDCNQKEVFEKSAEPLLNQLVLGYNVTVMAYGPTGSGKSYTLGTSNAEVSFQHENDAGLLAQIISWIFSKKTLSSEEDGQISKVQVSFLEIYKEEIFDLLSSTVKKIEIKNDKVENVVMENISEVEVHSQENALDLIHTANMRRQVKKTKSNDSSSRSHAIISLKMEINKNGETRFSTFKIVDLAGSEAVAKDGVMGEIKNEGIFINKGLLALGKVITALNSKNASHIPHRESILTRALKDSLSGNSLTVLICCVKADVHSITTTSAALQFASKARAIKTKVQPSVFKTPFKVPPPQLKTPGKTPFKTPGSTPFRTPLAQIQRNKVVTPGGSSFAVPEKMGLFEKCENLDESVLVSGSFARNLPKLSESDIENRIQTAVMERVDIFLEGFKDKLAQSLLANCSGAHFSCQSLLDGNSTNNLSHTKACCHSELDAFNLTSALTGNKILASENIGSRRRSVRLAEKRMTILVANNSRPTPSTPRCSTATKVSKKKSPVLPLPTPEGKSQEDVIKYKKDLLYFLNYASQSQIQKLPSVGPKAGHSIITFRNLNGMFKDFETVKLVPGLRKNSYDYFMKVNFLE